MGSPETESHIMYDYPANEVLRGTKDLNDDKQLVEFFQAVINRRLSKTNE